MRPGNPEPGFAYSFAGGYLDNPFAFDPAPFGISPREAQQMDPQQRLLLEVVWEALEDAAIPASSLAGKQVGVYVGASLVDYQGGASQDPAVIESHFMTGNSLSILSNRISYVFDFKGPSFTIDSACSSSFVALKQALDALEDGKIELAIVGGVNLLLAPLPFIGFSQARMLSPTGLSRPFSAKADGYVRSEGSVVLVLRRRQDALALGERVRGYVVGAAVNSDGKTSGISLPSREGQQALIESFYAQAGLSPDDLAFIEAHGTGTKVGDPIEAQAIGAALGQKRRDVLPIGSVKSNVGHLEAASGLAGLLKSMLALERGVLPRSLFLDEVNEAIDFSALNLVPNAAERPLDRSGKAVYAGICNYGFGGTNAHVLLRAPEAAPSQAAPAAGKASHLILSAGNIEGLRAQARQIAKVIEAGAAPEAVARSIGHCRDLLKSRLALPIIEEIDIQARLRDFADGESVIEPLVAGTAAAPTAPLVFVFSGNGGQYAEMGHAAFAESAAFRQEIAAIDQVFAPLAGWSIARYLQAPIPAADLQQTSLAQPMIYAIQSALVGTLARQGLKPECVIGHSVGEVAAAEAAGVLSRAEAIRLIHVRSLHQERVRGQGRMMVVAADEATLTRMIADFGQQGLEIAATNSATSTTLSGPAGSLKLFAKQCRLARIATVPLDIDYPFHSSALAPLEAEMRADLAFLTPRTGSARFISAVTGDLVSGERLDADYWWRNIRHPVRFGDAIRHLYAADQVHAPDSAIFVEIGPRSILAGAISENLREIGKSNEVIPSLAQKPQPAPIAQMIGRLVVAGAAFDRGAMFGAPPARPLDLPHYPFQRQDFNLPGTSEALNSLGKLHFSAARHPLLGARMADGSPEWRSLIDPVLLPYLEDHKVDGGVIVPASALIDMALSVGRDLFGEAPLELDEFDIFKPLTLPREETREVSTRYADGTGIVEIWSRKRFSAQEWVLHARGRIASLTRPPAKPLDPPIAAQTLHDNVTAVYAEATRAGLEYGPYFRLVTASARDAVTNDAQLAEPAASGLGAFQNLHVLHPISLDAAFHGLFISRPQKDGERKAHLPVRFRKIGVWRPGAIIRRSITLLTHETDRFKTIAISLFDAQGELVAAVEAAVLKALYFSKATTTDRNFIREFLPLDRSHATAPARGSDLPLPAAAEATPTTVAPAWLIVRAFAVSLAYRLFERAGLGAEINLPAILAAGRIPESARGFFEAARVVLGEFGLIGENGTLGANPLPEPEAILSTLLANFPQANLEIRLAAAALQHAEQRLFTGERRPRPTFLKDQVEVDGLLTSPALLALRLAVAEKARVTGGKLRVLALFPWSAGLIWALGPLVEAGDIELTLLARDRKAIDAARHLGRFPPSIAFFDCESAGAFSSPVPFDCVAVVASSPIGLENEPVLGRLIDLVGADAEIFVAQPGADATLDFLGDIWAVRNNLAEGEDAAPLRVPARHETMLELERLGARALQAQTCEDGLGALIRGRLTPSDAVMTRAMPDYRLIGRLDDPFVAALCAKSAACFGPESMPEGTGQGTQAIVFWAGTPAGTPLEALAGTIDALRSLILALEAAGSKARLLVLTRGAQVGAASPLAPFASGVWGFGRVAINEFPNVDIRLADFDPALPPNEIAAAFERILSLSGDELELAADRSGISCLRMRRLFLPPVPLAQRSRSVLRFETAGRLDSFHWIEAARQAPSPGEIEIEIAATGLNYRDILVGLGILDDDLLGAGLTAASLGFECSGIVTRLGEGVEHLAIGDAVMGFAVDTFASHLVAPSWHFFKVPEGIALQAAATIPVAFATAWFALFKRARIEKGETVLIHGGAGGVGLAAIQLAKAAGATVLATASTPARRAIAAAAGADYTFESRHERFVDPIREQFGGVDVVLNSLAGAAMTASFKLLKPFGRFAELGKRDYLDNTQLGLRPFVRNIAYFGIDLDELLAHDRPMVEAMMAEISQRFARGELKPLSYRVFQAQDVGAAFRVMQASEHVGKIVIAPARLALPDTAQMRYRPQKGVYLIVGGTSGLGFAAGQWLARQGAGTIVLASRRGRLEAGLEEAVESLVQAGTRIRVEALDAADAEAVAELVARMTREEGPLRGIIHAAVLLEDGLIAGLAPDRLRAVLAPKLLGAENLDRASADHPLDFFVVFSSATTVIGSPGQGAYVAANAWLEGFARARRAQGKPALAIGWGAISDVGIIARDADLGRRLRRTTGVVGLSSVEALAHMGRLLALGEAVEPMQFYTNVAPSAAAEKLRLLQSPAFAGLGLARRDEEGTDGGDLVTAIEGKTRNEAIGLIVEALKREVSHILRMPETEIDAARPLDQLGLDSLMALELQLSIERLCGTDIPMVGAGDRRLADLAATIFATLRSPNDTVDEAPGQDTALMLAMKDLHSDQAVSSEDVAALSLRMKVGQASRVLG